MRHQFLTVPSSLVRRSRREAVSSRPALERLEDRCLPSANFMPMMGTPMMMGTPFMGRPFMPMQHTGMGTAITNTPVTGSLSMNTTNNGLNGGIPAALDQLFTDFNRTMQQVLSSQNLQQFVVNEAALLRIIAADLMHLRAVESPMTRLG